MIRNVVFIMMYILCQFAYSAVDIVICEDNEGNQSFHQACPPGTNLIEKKKVSTGKDTSKEVDLAELNIVIYTIPECLSCEEVIIYMKSRDIPFNEKDINKDVETQKELTEITGKLTVPVTVIGEDHITGYDREKIASILDRILSPE
ncbi:MAG: glutaredoxin family protein [Pseudomonadota bacterium]|nr:glutaredoxin family protein [Pseudomonadota bacterium]